MPHRSSRVPTDLSLNRLAETRLQIGEIPYDLTISNPTVCGLPYPSDLLAGLADARGLIYDPDPRGPLDARRVIASLYEDCCSPPDQDRVVLTASTSEAYSFLFRLLCDPGETVLVPSPSYPLFGHLAGLDGIEAATYRLDHEASWRVDFPTLEEADNQVRAVVVVHPNNPTGSFVHPDDRERLVALCRERDWALIADEVFLPFPLDGGPGQDGTFATVDGCLCCTLGGLSKSLGLPQLKLAWIAFSGPEELVDSTLEGFDYVADAYLSVSTPIALAAPSLLAAATPVHDAIAKRCRTNLGVLRDLATGHQAVTVPRIGGGWSAALRVPVVTDDEELCRRLLLTRGVAVHPGGPFGFDSDGWLVISLLPTVECFAEGVSRLFDGLADSLKPRFDSNGA